MIENLEALESDSEAKVELTEATDHVHTWEVDADGNGSSKEDPAIDHVHEAISFLALPCTEDGHTHKLGLPTSTDDEEWLIG